MNRISLGLALVATLCATQINAEDMTITGFRQQQVDLFDATGMQRLERLDTSALKLPLPIIDTLPTGHYVVQIDDKHYSIKKRFARTDRVYNLSSSCNNTVAAHKTAASRGLGNGECQ